MVCQISGDTLFMSVEAFVEYLGTNYKRPGDSLCATRSQ